MAMSIPIFFKLLAMAISIAIVVAIQYQWQYQYQFFSKSIPMSMAISIVSIVLEQYQWSINQLLLKPINTNCNVNCSNGELSIVNGNINTSKMSIPMVCQYYCSCLLITLVLKQSNQSSEYPHICACAQYPQFFFPCHSM